MRIGSSNQVSRLFTPVLYPPNRNITNQLPLKIENMKPRPVNASAAIMFTPYHDILPIAPFKIYPSIPVPSVQEETAVWSAYMTDTYYASSQSVCNDTQNNVYTVGTFTLSPLSLYNRNMTVFSTLNKVAEGPSSYDCFIVKYDSIGNGLWATKIGGIDVYIDFVSICSDTENNIYVSGTYNDNTINVYNKDGSLYGTLENSGLLDFFVVKYSSEGNVLWTTRIGGLNNEYNYIYAKYIATDTSNNLYISGKYTSNPVSIYNKDGSIFTTISTNDTSIFLVKYNSEGFGTWFTNIECMTNEETSSTISVDKYNSIYLGIVGFNTNSNTFKIYNSDGSIFRTLPTGLNNFIVKYNSNGYGIFSTYFNLGGAISSLYSISSGLNCFYVTGMYYNSPITFYNQDGTVFKTLLNSGNFDAYLVKYDLEGNGIWATHISGPNNEEGLSLVSDLNHNIYISGDFGTSETITVYSQDGTVFKTLTNSGSGNYDGFIVKYNESGIGLLTISLNTTSNINLYSMSIDSDNNLYLTGTYYGTMTISNSDGSIFQTLPEGSNGFLVKYKNL